MDRRTFLKAGSLFTVGAATGGLLPLQGAWAFSQSMALEKFIQPLRRFGADIPLATPDGSGFNGATHYTIAMEEISDVLHPSMPAGTRLWAYTNGAVKRHMGAGIVARRNEKVQVTFVNKLPGRHILPVDTTIPGAELGPGRVKTRLSVNELRFELSHRYLPTIVEVANEALHPGYRPNTRHIAS